MMEEKLNSRMQVLGSNSRKLSTTTPPFQLCQTLTKDGIYGISALTLAHVVKNLIFQKNKA